MESYDAAKQALDGLHRELMDLNPSAARSLAEGMEETLTVHDSRPPQLRQTLASTNVIESAFSVVERVCANVKRWHRRRSARALGGLGPSGRGETVPSRQRAQADPTSAPGVGNPDAQDCSCQKEESLVK